MSSQSPKLQLTLMPRGTPSQQRIFSLVFFVYTIIIFALTVFSSLLIQDFMGCLAIIPTLIACTIRKERLSRSLAIWGIVTLVLITMNVLINGYSIFNPYIIASIFSMLILTGGSYVAHKLYSPVIHDETEICKKFEEKLQNVKNAGPSKFGISLEALRISDSIGVSKFFSVRNASFLSCLAPFAFVLLSRTSDFSVYSCYNSNGDQIDNSFCIGNLLAAGISLEVYSWNLPIAVMLDILIIRISTLVIIYFFLQNVLLLHKYRAKLFGAGIRFTNNLSNSALVEDYLWNFQAIFLLSILEFIVPNNPSISGLTPTDTRNLYMVNNIISYNETTPPGENFYAYLYTANYGSTNIGTFVIFIWTVIVNCSFIVSIYGYYLNSNTSALLAFFKEGDLLDLASKWNIKIRYEIENKNNEMLKVIRYLHKKYKHEKIEEFVEALLIILEENGCLKNSYNVV